MRDWDESAPGRGDTDELDELVYRLAPYLDTLAGDAVEIERAAAELDGAWSGTAADQWQADVSGVVAELRTFAHQARPGAEAVNTYLWAVRDIATRADRAVEDLAEAGGALRRAERRLAQVLADPDHDTPDLMAAHTAMQIAEEDRQTAIRTVSWLAMEPQSADTYLASTLAQGMPSAWQRTGPLTSTLPVTAFDRGPDGLALWLAGLPEGGDGDAAARWLVEHLSAADCDALLAEHPEIAVRLMRADTSGTFAARFPALEAALALSDPDQRIGAVVAACAELTATELTVLARCYPGVVHNLDGAPLTVRIAANRVAISAHLVQAREALAAMESLVAGQTAGASPMQQALIDAWRDSIDWCEDLLFGETRTIGPDGEVTTARGHQVVAFDPAASVFGELVGRVDAPNIGVLVGGTGTNLGQMPGQFDRAWDFAERAKGELTMITYLNGRMPQTLTQAVDGAYAKNIAPTLASFVNGVRASTRATITVAGHSYGGSVVGRAEVEGMIADRILHIESAGVGPGVDSVTDYARPDTPRYTMTAPGDPIGVVQGGSGNILAPHGADPDTLPGFIQLETGRVDATDPYSAVVQGGGSHSGVFGDPEEERRPDAWTNMLEVMIGGEVGLWTAPTYDVVNGIPTVTHYPMSDPAFSPPMAAVR